MITNFVENKFICGKSRELVRLDVSIFFTQINQ